MIRHDGRLKSRDFAWRFKFAGGRRGKETELAEVRFGIYRGMVDGNRRLSAIQRSVDCPHSLWRTRRCVQKKVIHRFKALSGLCHIAQPL
jgi:hypothetical protein